MAKKSQRLSQQLATRKYVKVHYDTISLNLPKGAKAIIKEAADALNLTVSTYITTAISEKIGVNLVLNGSLNSRQEASASGNAAECAGSEANDAGTGADAAECEACADKEENAGTVIE